MLPQSSEGYERKQDNGLQQEVLALLGTQLSKIGQWIFRHFDVVWTDFVRKLHTDYYLESSYL